MVVFMLNPKRVIQVMLSIIALLTVMHITQLVVYFHINDPEVFDFIKLIDFDYEANLPSFYSSAAVIFCAVLLWVIGLDKHRKYKNFRYHWLGLAIIFTFLGMDEAIGLHEDIGDVMENQQWVNATGFLYFAWVVPYGILLLLFLTAYLKFVFSLPRQTMSLFIIAGTLFVSGAVGVEIISANEADMNGTETIYYSVLYTIEELCEMIGIVIFCYALMNYLEAQGSTVQFHINSDQA